MEFTPAEAEAITGVTTAVQRQWRRCGLLPALNGSPRAKFDAADLALMLAARAMIDAGVSWEDSKKGRYRLAYAILAHRGAGAAWVIRTAQGQVIPAQELHNAAHVKTAVALNVAALAAQLRPHIGDYDPGSFWPWRASLTRKEEEVPVLVRPSCQACAGLSDPCVECETAAHEQFAEDLGDYQLAKRLWEFGSQLADTADAVLVKAAAAVLRQRSMPKRRQRASGTVEAMLSHIDRATDQVALSGGTPLARFAVPPTV